MNGMSSLAGLRGIEISVVLAVACGLVAVGVLVMPAIKPALVVSILLGLFFGSPRAPAGYSSARGRTPTPGCC
jgi:hypothetical protein